MSKKLWSMIVVILVELLLLLKFPIIAVGVGIVRRKKADGKILLIISIIVCISFILIMPRTEILWFKIVLDSGIAIIYVVFTILRPKPIENTRQKYFNNSSCAKHMSQMTSQCTT